MKIEVKGYAYIDKYNEMSPAQLATPEGVASMAFMKSPNMADYGYTYISEAMMVVEVPDVKTLVENRIEALRGEAATLRAETTAKCTAIESQIQNLLAISFDDNPKGPV